MTAITDMPNASLAEREQLLTADEARRPVASTPLQGLRRQPISSDPNRATRALLRYRLTAITHWEEGQETADA